MIGILLGEMTETNKNVNRKRPGIEVLLNLCINAIHDVYTVT